MKGRRKVKTDKWRTKLKYESAVRAILQGRTETEGRFIDIAARIGKRMEPVGRLTG